MNYNKLQLSFVLLLIMTFIQLLTSLFVLKSMWIILTSIFAMGLCVAGLFYSIHQEQKHK